MYLSPHQQNNDQITIPSQWDLNKRKPVTKIADTYFENLYGWNEHAAEIFLKETAQKRMKM